VERSGEAVSPKSKIGKYGILVRKEPGRVKRNMNESQSKEEEEIDIDEENRHCFLL